MFRAPGCRLRLGRNTSHNSGGATGKALYWILAAVACLVLSTQSWDLARIEMCGVRPPAEPTPMGWRGEAAHSVNGTYMLSERGRRGQRATATDLNHFSVNSQPSGQWRSKRQAVGRL